MTMHVRTVAVLGAGTMGAQIAAHVANAGVPVLLLDVTREAARDGLKRAQALKPDPFFTPDAAALIRSGGFEDDLQGIAGRTLQEIEGLEFQGLLESPNEDEDSERQEALFKMK